MHLAEYYEFKALKAGMEIGYKIDKELKLTTTTGETVITTVILMKKDGKLRQRTVFFVLETSIFRKVFMLLVILVTLNCFIE